MIKVLALQRESLVTSKVFSLSVSARVVEVLDYLQEQNDIEYIVLEERNPVIDNALDWCDVLILCKHSSVEALRLVIKARKKGKKVIYDIDDWIFSFPSYSGGSEQIDKIKNIKSMVIFSDHVTVANKNILAEIEQYRKDVILMPNGFYVEKYIDIEFDQIKNIKEDDPPRIIFTNADLLKVDNSKIIFLNVLQEFFHEHPDFILDFYGDPFPEMFSMSFLHYTNRMRYEHYMTALINGRYLFSITPLGGIEDRDSLFFNSCKNPFKYLNYGTACVPGIYSKTPIYEECIRDSQNGLLVENNFSDWIDALNRLTEDKELRTRIRENAFWDIKENFHISYSADVLKKLINNNEYTV